MSQALPVSLYDTKEGTFKSGHTKIQDALDAAVTTEGLSSCFIHCDEYFHGEDSDIRKDSVVASIQFYHSDAYFGHNDFDLKGEIELQYSDVTGVKNFKSTANNITLIDSSAITASTKVSAAGKIAVSDDSKIIVGYTDTEFTGGIKLDAEKEMTAGDSITAGKIKVGANATITATAGSITATTGDITLDGGDGSYSYDTKMTAGDSIVAENINVGISTAIEATNGSITANSDITLADTSTAYVGAKMTAGDSIAAGGKITLGEKATVKATNGSITANGNITLNAAGQDDYFATMTALESIAAGGKIELGSCAIVEATNGSITANGDITLHDIYFSDPTKMTAGDSIAAGGKITLGTEAEMTASSIKAKTVNNTNGQININVAAGFTGTKKVIDVDSATGLVLDNVSLTGPGASGVDLIQLTSGDVFITNYDILYVNADWEGRGEGEEVSIGSKNATISIDAFATAALAVTKADSLTGNKTIMVIGGEFGDISSLGGYNSVFQAGTFNRGVMGGRLVTTADTVNVGSITMTVYGGTYKKLVAAGDCVNSGSAIRCGSYTPGEGSDPAVIGNTTITFTIAGGVFEKNVAGGMEYMKTDEADGFSTLYGNIYLNVSGGDFQGYLYGGNIAANKSVSGSTSIMGNVTTTIDATGIDTIKLNKVVAGSYGNGTIDGDAKLILKGKASNLDFAATGEIWGGCGGDTYKAGTPGEREFKSTVSGKRILSFTGFSGKIDSDCAKIRGFSDIEFLDDSNVALDAAVDTYSLSDVQNWTFDYGSSLTGKFVNNFTDDTLTMNLNGLVLSGLSAEWEWTVLENTSTAEDAFKGFGGADADHRLQVSLSLNDDAEAIAMTWSTEDSCYTGGGCKFSLDNNKLVLTLA